MLSGFLKWSLVFILSDVVWCDTCQPEFKSNLGDILVVSYDIKRLDVTKMSLGLVDTQPFMEMFTNSCREMVKTLGVEYRVVGETIWNRYLGRRGTISTNKRIVDIQNIDPCLEYEVQFLAIANDDSEHKAPHLHFGPFHKELNQEEIAMLNYESMPDISHSITYSNITSSGFTVSWGQICAQSANVFLLTAPDFDYGSPYTFLSNLLKDGLESSLRISTQPCQEYKVAIESFMTNLPTPEAEKEDESRDHVALDTVITDPKIEDLVTAFMEEGSHLLKWEFAQQIPCLSEFRFEILLTGETGNDIHLLKSGDLEEESGSIDLANDTFAECSNYQLEMKVSYKTKASHSFEETVFGKQMRTNQVGKFAVEGTNDMHIVHDIVHVTFDSCNKEAILCLTEDETLVMHVTVTSDAPNVPIQSFLEVTENCVEYKISLHNNETDQIYAEAEFPTKPPKEEIDFQMTNFTISSLAFEVLGAEENKRCSINKYTVTCKNPEEFMSISEFNDVEHEHVDHSGHVDHTQHEHDDHLQQGHVDHSGHQHDDHSQHEHDDHLQQGHDDHTEHQHDDHTQHEHDDHLQQGHDDHTEHQHDDDHPQHQHDDNTKHQQDSQHQHTQHTPGNHIQNQHNHTDHNHDGHSEDEHEDHTQHNHENDDFDVGAEPESTEGSGELNIDTLHSNEENTITAFIGASVNSSRIEIANLAPRTMYECEASIKYDVLGNIERIDSGHIFAETEGFDELEITEDGTIIVTCNSRIEELQLALVFYDGNIVETVDANCIDNDHIDMFKNLTEECVEYTIELYDAKKLEEFILYNNFTNPSVLTPIDQVPLPVVKAPERVPELQFVSSHNSSLTFDILIDAAHHCNVTFYCVTCSNGRDYRAKHHSVDPQVTVDGLERDNTYNCSAHVEFQSTEDAGSGDQQGWTTYSSIIEAHTEGFDEMELLEDGDVLVTCGSNIEELNIVLVEEGGRKVDTKEASCNDTTSIDKFITNMKPCGEYKIGLIAKQEYDELIEQGEWKDGVVTVFDEVLLDIKQPEGQPELRFAASHSDFVELDIVDELNGFCGVETIEVQCEGMVDDTNVKISKVPNTDELLVPSTVVISGLSPDNSYTCSAMVQYSQIAGNQTINVSSKYHPASNPLVVKTSQEIQLFAEPKSNSNTVIYILVAGGVILIIVIAIIICKRRKSGGKDFVETANENVVHHKDAEKDMGSTDVEVEEEK